MSNKTGNLDSIETAKIRVKILKTVLIGGMTHNGTPSDVIKKCKAIEEYVLEGLIDLEELVDVINSLYPGRKISYNQIVEAYKRLIK